MTRSPEWQNTTMAEMISNGATLAVVAAALHITTRAAEKRWKRIRDSLGWQAR